MNSFDNRSYYLQTLACFLQIFISSNDKNVLIFVLHFKEVLAAILKKVKFHITIESIVLC